MKIPSVPRSREGSVFWEDRPLPNAHVRGPDDFCVACGGDLRVPRRLVRAASLLEQARLDLYEAVEFLVMAEEQRHLGVKEKLGQHLILPALQALTIPKIIRRRMRFDFCDAIDPVVNHVYCGLENVDIVGIADDGTYLYEKLPQNRRLGERRRVVALCLN